MVCTYQPELFPDFRDAADSVLNQNHDDVELVAVVDGNEEAYSLIEDEYGGRDRVKLHLNDENLGLSASRNRGVELASGDVVAFMDDDAVADPEWIEELVRTYREHDAVAVGGRMTPKWVAGKPGFLPEEYYWLVGVTHRGFRGTEGEVRNTFGSNISFRKGVLERVGGFDPGFGRKGDRQLQSEETEVAARVREEFGEGVIYNPDARVAHKVFRYRTRPAWLVKRAFWQGYSKRHMEVVLPESDGNETEFLSKLLLTFIPGRVSNLVQGPSIPEVKQLLMLFVLTASVGFGYLYGYTKWNFLTKPAEEKES